MPFLGETATLNRPKKKQNCRNYKQNIDTPVKKCVFLAE